MKNTMGIKKGFTLIELVLVIIILAIVSLGVTNFVSSGAQIFVDVTERTQLVSESRFATERLNREIRNAVPNSVRVSGNGSTRHCIEFMPIKWSSFYLDIPVAPESTDQIDVVKWGGLDAYEFAEDDIMIVYPTSPFDVYTDTGKTQLLSEESDGDPGVTELEFDSNVQFATDSPSSRFYVYSTPVSYCVENRQLRRYANYAIQATQPLGLTNGVLMAENLTNSLSDTAGEGSEDPFRLTEASLTRTASVLMLLRFERDGESVIFNNEVQVPNVP